VLKKNLLVQYGISAVFLPLLNVEPDGVLPGDWHYAVSSIKQYDSASADGSFSALHRLRQTPYTGGVGC